MAVVTQKMAPMKVLLVKLSSMGDIIHALPALSDAMYHLPNIEFDWVIDQAFAEIASWHPAVKNTIVSDHRSWRKQKWQAIKSGEIGKFIKSLRLKHYDLVIDGQGNIKSAIITRLTRGKRCGFDCSSAKEWVANFAYQQKYHIDKQQHAIKRIRLLFAQALGYDCPNNNINFSVDQTKFVRPTLTLPDNYLVFVHHASYPSKLWPDDYWHQLISKAKTENYHVLLTCGNQQEHQRAQQLASGHSNALALEKLPLAQIAYILSNAAGAICSDTGLSHLASTVNTLSVSLYGATDAKLIGTAGTRQVNLQSDFPCNKCYKKHCFYNKPSEQTPACFTRLPPDLVWQQFKILQRHYQQSSSSLE